LIAAQHSIEEIREFIDADSLAYLSVEGMMKAVRGSESEFCAACFDGNYPTKIEEEFLPKESARDTTA
jgi:amidophosphoribosyltransferase